MPADYERSVSRLIVAGRQLEEALAQNVDPTDASEELRRAAVVAEVEAREFRFSTPDSGAHAEPSQSGQEALIEILLDVQSGSMLMAAGQAIPDGSSPSQSTTYLSEALERLELSQREISRAPRAGRSMFSADAPRDAAAGATPQADPVRALRDRTKTTLAGMVNDADGVVQSTIKELKKLDPTRVNAAFSSIVNRFEALTAAKDLVRLGLAKLRKALEALKRLVGGDLIAAAQKKIASIWHDARDGKYSKAVLAGLFGVDETIHRLEERLGQARDTDILRDAGTALSALAVEFQKHARLLGEIASAIGIAAAIVAFLPIATQAIPFVAGAYALVIAAVVVVGVDYADSGLNIGWVRGVRSIVNGLSPAPAR